MPESDTDNTIPPDPDAEGQRSLGSMPTMGGERRSRRFRTGAHILGRYRITGELGQGGMGAVYRCYDETGGVDVALPPGFGAISMAMPAMLFRQ